MKKEYQKKYQAEYRKKHRDRLNSYALNFYHENPERKLKYLEKNRQRSRGIRLIVLKHYSSNIPFCACCGEREIKFLSLDHINGGGNKHRYLLIGQKKGGNMYVWAMKNGFPPIFQVLCHNCNMAKGFYGECPHKE